VPNLASEIKNRLEIELNELNYEFDYERFLELYTEMNDLIQMGFLTEIESFLHRLLTEHKLGIVNGFLYLIYFNLGPREKSGVYRDAIKKIFPDDDFWDNLANGSLWDEFSHNKEKDV